MADELTGCADDQIYGHFSANEVRMAAEIARLRSQLAIKDKALREVEWHDLDGYEDCCPVCKGAKGKGHKLDCLIARALSPSLTDGKNG